MFAESPARNKSASRSRTFSGTWAKLTSVLILTFPYGDSDKFTLLCDQDFALLLWHPFWINIRIEHGVYLESGRRYDRFFTDFTNTYYFNIGKYFSFVQIRSVTRRPYGTFCLVKFRKRCKLHVCEFNPSLQISNSTFDVIHKLYISYT